MEQECEISPNDSIISYLYWKAIPKAKISFNMLWATSFKTNGLNRHLLCNSPLICHKLDTRTMHVVVYNPSLFQKGWIRFLREEFVSVDVRTTSHKSPKIRAIVSAAGGYSEVVLARYCKWRISENWEAQDECLACVGCVTRFLVKNCDLRFMTIYS